MTKDLLIKSDILSKFNSKGSLGRITFENPFRFTVFNFSASPIVNQSMKELSV